MSTLLQPDEQVLSTLRKDGSRRWLNPKLSHGRFLTRRRAAAYALIAIFTLLPYVKINEKPAILLDLVHRHFTLLGFTFLPTDTVLLALFMVSVLLSIFIVTALFGRVWCGWACPQTVYMEFVYRPIERLFLGTAGRGGTPRQVPAWRRLAMYAAYLMLSMYLAHTFLAYFVGVDALALWVRSSPLEHPVAFVVMAGTTAMMLFDFCFFREQTCIIACPYGRLQSVLLDRSSLIVSYDPKRGEPRAKGRREAGENKGDCVDCAMCVTTCPTGIDIRKGLQMECIGCAQCIDACDTVMDRIGTPRGLIRYSSQLAIDGVKPPRFRPRLVFYPALLLIVASLFTLVLINKRPADVTLLRERGNPFTVLPTGEIANGLRIKIVNRTDVTGTYQITPVTPQLQVARSESLTLRPTEMKTEPLTLLLPPSAFKAGTADVTLRVTGSDGFSQDVTYRMLGPQGATP